MLGDAQIEPSSIRASPSVALHCVASSPLHHVHNLPNASQRNALTCVHCEPPLTKGLSLLAILKVTDVTKLATVVTTNRQKSNNNRHGKDYKKNTLCSLKRPGKNLSSTQKPRASDHQLQHTSRHIQCGCHQGIRRKWAE